MCRLLCKIPDMDTKLFLSVMMQFYRASGKTLVASVVEMRAVSGSPVGVWYL